MYFEGARGVSCLFGLLSGPTQLVDLMVGKQIVVKIVGPAYYALDLFVLQDGVGLLDEIVDGGGRG